MATTLRDKLKTLSPERQEKIARRTADLIEEEISLRELRETCELTQEHMAELLGVPQGSVSRLENRSDWRLSTLRNYVQAMGGDLDVIIKLPNHPAFRLADLPRQRTDKLEQRTHNLDSIDDRNEDTVRTKTTC